MSLKENIDMVKDELNQEEKFFESAVKVERFYKKYKMVLVGGVVAVIVVIAGTSVYNVNQEENILAANNAFNTLKQDANNTAAAAELQKLSPELFDVWSLSQALAKSDVQALKTLKSSKTIAVSDLATYELAANNSDTKALSTYAYKQNAIYKDLALVETSVLLMQEGKVVQAHEKLAMIENDSPMYKVSRLLMHYGAK